MATKTIPRTGPIRGQRPAVLRQPMRPVKRRPGGLWGLFVGITPVVILLFGLLLPVEVRLNFFGQTFYAYRIACLLVMPWVVHQLLAGRLQFKLNDILVLLAAVWMVLAFVMVDGLSSGLASGLAIAMDVLIPYLAVRLSIRSYDQVRHLLVILAPIALVLGVLMAVEAITHFRVIRSGAQAIFGQMGAAEYGGEFSQGTQWVTRFGLLRATGPFSHPILAGVFFSALLPMYYFSRLRGWPLVSGMAAGLAGFFSLSSAAFLAMFMFVVLALYDWARKAITFLNWPIFVGVTAAVLTVLHFVSQNGLISVLIRYTLDPMTGYYRLLIWDYGSVANYPWFGIGHREYVGLEWMTGSVDTVWLAMAIRHGLAVPLLLGLAMILAILGLAMAASRDRTINSGILIGMAITLTVYFVLGFTVSFFGGLLVWWMMLIGIGTTFAQFTSPRQRPVRRRLVPRRNLDDRGRVRPA